jgi:hypothetical protein
LVGAGVEHLPVGAGVRVAGVHQYLHVRADALGCHDDVGSAAGHVDVQDQHVRLGGPNTVETTSGVAGFTDDQEAGVVLQHGADGVADFGFVVTQQHGAPLILAGRVHS